MTLLRRARPLLGTLVEVAVDAGPDGAAAMHAISEAFALIEHLHARMGFHCPHSDVSRINRARPGAIVPVGADTWEVLSAATSFSAASQGLFDVTIAPLMERAGFLPSEADAPPAAVGWQGLELLDGQRLRLQRAVRVDLGGIAKGYAVDRAVALLQAVGMRAGHVNAGGDLRVFGHRPDAVQVRHPQAPTRTLSLPLDLPAAATSAGYFQQRAWAGTTVLPIVDPRRSAPCAASRSVTVFARDCMTADALTKIVYVAPQQSGPILARFGARALVMEQGDGEALCGTHEDRHRV